MRILHFADLHLGVEAYGKLDPQTGLSTRLGDFLTAFDKLVDYAVNNDVDLVLFCGDAYKTRDPSPTQQREFARRVGTLASKGIPVFLLTGNHDVPNADKRATATEIFDTLQIKNVYFSNKPEVQIIQTKRGPIQIATLPWIRRGALLARDSAKNLTPEQVKLEIQRILTSIVSDHVAKIDRAIPAILAAHVWVSGATTGSEKSMSIGEDPALLKSEIANPAFDYVAVGHIHKHQVFDTNPPVVYSGSLERVDFGEEKDPKGFVVIDIETGADGKRHTSFEFHPLDGRRFLTIEIKLNSGELSPAAAVLQQLGDYRESAANAIVRLTITMPAEMEPFIRDNDIRSFLNDAHYLAINRDIKRDARIRLTGPAGQGTPEDVLKLFLESKYPPEKAAFLLEYGRILITERNQVG